MTHDTQTTKPKLHNFHAFVFSTRAIRRVFFLFLSFTWNIFTIMPNRMVDLHRCALHTRIHSSVAFAHTLLPHLSEQSLSAVFLAHSKDEFLVLFRLLPTCISIRYISFRIISSFCSLYFICILQCETIANLYAKLCNRIALERGDGINRKIEMRARARKRTKENVLSHLKLFKSHPCKITARNLRSFAHSATLWHRKYKILPLLGRLLFALSWTSFTGLWLCLLRCDVKCIWLHTKRDFKRWG